MYMQTHIYKKSAVRYCFGGLWLSW